MGKMYDILKRQLLSKEYRKNAEDCIKIFNKLKEINDGSVWESDWKVLTTTCGCMGKQPHIQMVYKPSKVGYIFLNGIKSENV